MLGGRGIEESVIREASEAPVVDGDYVDAEAAETIDRRGRNVLVGKKSQTARSFHKLALGCEIRVPADRVRREAYRRKHILTRDAVFLDYFVDGEATAELAETNSTLRRVPSMMAFPPKISGLATIRGANTIAGMADLYRPAPCRASLRSGRRFALLRTGYPRESFQGSPSVWAPSRWGLRDLRRTLHNGKQRKSWE